MNAPARIVVRGPNWLGDLVMATPAIREVGDTWPEACVDVAVPAGLAPIVSLLDPRVGVVPLAGRTGAMSRHAAQLRDGQYDLAILLTNSFGSALAAWRAGVGQRWGYRRDARGWLLTRAIGVRTVTRVSPHHADYYAALMEALGLARPPLALRVQLPRDARDEAIALLQAAGWDARGPLLACAPGAAYGTAKQWPPTSVAQAVSAWTAEGGAVALVGAAADRPAVRAVIAAASGDVSRLFDLAGATSLRALAGVLGLATRVLANDSGAMHLAAALGTPVVAVFGPTREHVTAPLGPHRILTHEVWCRPCMLRECPLDHRCMTGVTPDRVVDALRGISREDR